LLACNGYEIPSNDNNSIDNTTSLSKSPQFLEIIMEDTYFTTRDIGISNNSNNNKTYYTNIILSISLILISILFI